MQAYLASDLAKGVVGNPNFANLTSRDFEVLSGPTTSSGGPVAASLTATASLASWQRPLLAAVARWYRVCPVG